MSQHIANFPLIDLQRRFLIDWSAKSAATVVAKMFFNHLGLLEEALQYSDWIHDYREDIYNPAIKSVDLQKCFLDSTFVKIKFVRNPYSRAVSSYIHCLRFYMDWTPKKNQTTFLDFLIGI